MSQLIPATEEFHKRFTHFVHNAFQEKSSSKKAPAALYHYTSLDGLRGILDNTSFWASRIEYLNDKLEMKHGATILERCLNEYNGRHLTVTQQKLLFMIQKLIADFLNNDRHHVPTGMVPLTPYEYYTVSFSSGGDSLPQWRAYGDVALGFEPRQLSNSATNLENQLFGVLPVVYHEPDQESICRNILSFLMNSLKDTDPRNELILIPSIQGFVTMLLLLKHKAFATENEWRFIAMRKHGVESVAVNFRSTSKILLPYIEVELPNGLPLIDVKVGPCDEMDYRTQSIRNFLYYKNYNPAIVTQSALPFRT